jgi:uncharacterized cupredoxin-like copper-binding protein
LKQHSKRKAIRALLGAGMLTLARGATAHGEKPHAGKPASARKEQKDWGIAGDAKAARRSIQVGMGDDMKFSPALIEVELNETIRFVVRNRGKLLHEFVIGTRKELEDHAALMLKFPNMEHDEPYMAHVAPGQRGQIVWQFNRPGEFEFACLVAGHFQAGMKGRLIVRS